METPGHTRGSVCYFAGDAVFTGDTFFADGYGRTDLYGGNEQLILHSLRKLVTCMKGKRAYPGHGEPTDV
jgi:glyoxylase-like metal-dependent hydrolase (beta-lactamase superfamily II)